MTSPRQIRLSNKSKTQNAIPRSTQKMYSFEYELEKIVQNSILAYISSYSKTSTFIGSDECQRILQSTRITEEHM